MALTFAAYAVPGGWQRPVAALAVAVLTAVTLRGISRTALLTRVLLAVVLVALTIAVAAASGRITAPAGWPAPVGGAYGVLQSAGLLFFAFAGYARIATLGEEVRDPRRAIPRAVLAALAAAVAGMLLGGTADPANLASPGPGTGPVDILQAAGLLFFAFAGYARVATLGEEVADPARTIPRAVSLALGIVLVVYAVVCAAALLAVGPAVLAAADAPLAEAVAAGRLAALEPAVRAGAAVASLGVLLSLQAGLSRTAFAMAANRDLPAALAAVHPRHRVPHRAELAVAGLVAAAVLAVDLRAAIGFSSVLVLVYYTVANAAAWTLGPAERRRPRWLAGAGVAGCLVLAASLPAASVVAGAAVLAAGVAVWVVRSVRAQPL